MPGGSIVPSMEPTHPSRREATCWLASVPVLSALLPGVVSAPARGADVAAHAQYATGLRLIHRVLERNLATIVNFALDKPEMQAAPFARFVATYVRFLELHHRGEDDFIFPVLRAHSAGRSSDVAFLEARVQEHQQVHGAIEALGAAAGRYRAGHAAELDVMATIATDLRDLLTPHLIVEECGLTAEHLAEMVPANALADANAAMQERDQDEGGSDVLMMLVHSLTPGEQQTLLSDLPWFVRRVLIRGIWARGWEPLMPFTFEPRVVI